MISIVKEYRPAIAFILKFLGMYMVLNTAYGLYVEAWGPSSDPITYSIALIVAKLLSLFHGDVATLSSQHSAYMPLIFSNQTIVNVFEGCNGVNVIIVYLSFLIAFTRNFKSTILFSAFGTTAILLMNLLRVSLLFEVALNFPDHLYFFHKYLFTGFIYSAVFVIWYFWIKQVKQDEQRAN